MGKVLKNWKMLLRYLDLVLMLDELWREVKGSAAGNTVQLPVIKTKVSNRKVEVGPTPVKFLE